MKIYNIIFSILFLLSLSGCATYLITIPSLVVQLSYSQQEKKTMSVNVIAGITIYKGVVSGNSLHTIEVLDKKGTQKVIPVTFHTGVKITKNNGKHKTFYFNTLLIQDSTITGHNTHFFKSPIKPIKFSEIRKIELQK